MTTVADHLQAAGINLRFKGVGEHRGPCPRCSAQKHRKHDDALAVRINSDSATWICFRCDWRGAVSEGRPASGNAPRPTPRPAPKPEPDRRVLDRRGRELWDRAQPITEECPIGQYLRNRCCEIPGPDAVRWIPDLVWQAPKNLKGCGEDGSFWPAMVGLVTDVQTGEPLNIHKTFVRPDGGGKADVPRPRLTLANHRKQGGVVALTPALEVGDHLVVGEGIESCLSGAVQPVWALVDAGNLGALPVLDGIMTLMVLVDHDPAGLRAWRKVAARWAAAGRDVRRALPPTPGADFNDWVAEAAQSPAERARWLLNRRYEAYDPERDAEDRDAKKWLAQVAGTLLRRRVPPVLARRLVHALNRADCEPRLADDEAEAIIEDIAGLVLARRGGAHGG